MPELVLVAAVAKNGVIGSDGDMPWKLSSDLKHFKATTLGKPMIMGRKTFESIGGKPLPGRPHIVISRDETYHPEGVERASSFEEALACAERFAADLGVHEVMCVGGGQIYSLAIDLADRLEITEVDCTPAGDTYFPKIDGDVWIESVRQQGVRTDKDSADFAFITYCRKAA